MLSVSQAADKLGVTPSRVRAMINAGRLSAVKCGKTWIIREEDVVDRLSKKPQAGRPPKIDTHCKHDETQSSVSDFDVKRVHRIYAESRELFNSLPPEKLMRQASSSEEASFYMAISDFFLQKRQEELIKQGVF